MADVVDAVEVGVAVVIVEILSHARGQFQRSRRGALVVALEALREVACPHLDVILERERLLLARRELSEAHVHAGARKRGLASNPSLSHHPSPHRAGRRARSRKSPRRTHDLLRRCRHHAVYNTITYLQCS